MADLTIGTVTQLSGSVQQKSPGTGLTLTPGQVVRSISGGLQLTDVSVGDPESEVVGITINGGSDIDQVTYLTSGGVIALGAVLVPGHAYYASGNPGFIADVPAAGDRTTLLGFAESTTHLRLKFDATKIIYV